MSLTDDEKRLIRAADYFQNWGVVDDEECLHFCPAALVALSRGAQLDICSDGRVIFSRVWSDAIAREALTAVIEYAGMADDEEYNDMLEKEGLAIFPPLAGAMDER